MNPFPRRSKEQRTYDATHRLRPNRILESRIQIRGARTEIFLGKFRAYLRFADVTVARVLWLERDGALQ